MLSACDGDKQLLMYCSPLRYDEVKQLARDLGLHRILAAMQVLDQTYTKMRYSTQGRILLELALVRIANLQQLQGIAVLIEQLRNGTLQALPPIQDVPSQSTAIPTTTPSAPPTATRFSEMLPPKPMQPYQPPNSGPEKKNDAMTVDVALKLPKTVRALDDAEVRRCWDAMTGQLSGMAVMQATLVHSVRFVPPDVVVVTFPSTQPLAKSYCENESQKIQAILRDLTGTPVRLRFETVTVEEPKKTPVPPVNTAIRKMQLVSEVSEHPMVKKAAELFGATLTEVKEGKNP